MRGNPLFLFLVVEMGIKGSKLLSEEWREIIYISGFICGLVVSMIYILKEVGLI